MAVVFVHADVPVARYLTLYEVEPLTADQFKVAPVDESEPAFSVTGTPHAAGAAAVVKIPEAVNALVPALQRV